MVWFGALAQTQTQCQPADPRVLWDTQRTTYDFPNVFWGANSHKNKSHAVSDVLLAV